jgi:hypothetical protein
MAIVIIKNKILQKIFLTNVVIWQFKKDICAIAERIVRMDETKMNERFRNITALTLTKTCDLSTLPHKLMVTKKLRLI